MAENPAPLTDPEALRRRLTATLRRRAKAILTAARAGDPAALKRCRSAVPRLAGLTAAELPTSVRLADALHVVALELGAKSWPRLKRQIEAEQPIAFQVGVFLAAVRDGRLAAARRLLDEHPAIARVSAHAAAALGEVEVLAALLAARPELATAPDAPGGWTPLLFACGSPFVAAEPARKEGTRRCAELLLDGGASPGEHTLWGEGESASPLTALYRACVTDQPALVRLLLERGADPDDGESVYHAAELDHRDCLEELRRGGAELSARHPRWGNTPLYFLAGYKTFHPSCAAATRGMHWLLEHGADPDVGSGAGDETPLHRAAAYGREPELAAALLAHDAQVDRRRKDGATAYTLAVSTGNEPMARFLRERGADVSALRPVDQFLGACMAADAERARELLERNPGLVDRFDEAGRQTFVLAAEEGRVGSVRLMHELGFDLAWEGPWGGTPLHHAAWHGRPPVVRLLLELGASIDARDREFGSSPLGWAAHGSANCRQADDDYRAVVSTLLDAGAGREASLNRWGEGPEALCTPAVEALLRERGFIPK